jgi:hypothetical protein
METFMLEHYFGKPSIIDRIRGGWLGSEIESYLEWLEATLRGGLGVRRRIHEFNSLPPLIRSHAIVHNSPSSRTVA